MAAELAGEALAKRPGRAKDWHFLRATAYERLDDYASALTDRDASAQRLNRKKFPRLNHQLARGIAESGPTGGIPEEIWKPFIEKAATPNSADKIKTWEDLLGQVKIFRAKA
ncbi:MAG: hypothetical protein Q8P46_10105 [Hyphomicrobiales bacterium]|nr:hypothetical protein [Hyphomicrobiales bacterium]